MCDPFTAMAIGGSVVSAAGSVTGGVQAFNGSGVTADFLQHNAEIQSGNADLALGNVDILKKQADVMRESGDVARAKARIALARTQDQGDIVAGGQVAHFTSSNLDPTSGSPLLLQLITASRVKGDMDLITASAEVERANIRTNAANIDVQAAGEAGRAASMYSASASSYGNATATRMKGSQALTAGIFGAATALLSAGGKMKGFSIPSFSGASSGGGMDGGSAAP